MSNQKETLSYLQSPPDKWGARCHRSPAGIAYLVSWVIARCNQLHSNQSVSVSFGRETYLLPHTLTSTVLILCSPVL